jgi:hypothetical protein
VSSDIHSELYAIVWVNVGYEVQKTLMT